MLNICVVGAGARGTDHARTWQAREDAQVVAVADTDTARAEALAAEMGAQPFADWRDAIAQEEVTVVSQCVPTALHAPVTVFAAERGRHVLGEKPMALTLEQGENMLQAVRENGVVFMPCFQYRDQALYRRYRELFQRGVFGGPIVFRFTDIREVRPKVAMHRLSMNGGVVIDMACHIFDLMRWITGREAERVYAAGHIFGRGKARLAMIDDFAVDEAGIEVTMEGDHQIQLYLNWGMPEAFPGVSSDQWLLGPELAVRPTNGQVEVIFSDHRELWPLGPDANPGTRVRIEQFVRAIQGEAELDITGEDALAALKLSLAALESIKTGEAQKL